MENETVAIGWAADFSTVACWLIAAVLFGALVIGVVRGSRNG